MIFQYALQIISDFLNEWCFFSLQIKKPLWALKYNFEDLKSGN